MLRERGIVLLKETHPRISCKAFLRVNMLRFFLRNIFAERESSLAFGNVNEPHQDTRLSSVTQEQQTLPKSAAET